VSTSPLDALVQAIADAVAARLAEQRAATQAEAAVAPPAESEWLDTPAAAKYLGIAPKTLQQWREEGREPKAHRIGRRAIRYARRDLEAFARRGRA